MANENRITLIIDANGNAAIEGFNKVTGSMKNMESETGGIISKIKSHWLGLSAAAIAAYATIHKAWNLAEMAAKYEEQKASLNSLAVQYGTSANQMIENIQKVTNGLISMRDIVTISGEAMARHLSPDQIINLAEAAETLSNISGTASENFTDLAQAIATGRMRGLESKLGFIDLNEVLGKQAEKLTDAGKAHYMYEEVMKRVVELQKKGVGATDSLNDKMDRLKVTVDDLQLLMGTLLLRSIAGVVGAYYGLAASIMAVLGAREKLRAFVLKGELFSSEAEKKSQEAAENAKIAFKMSSEYMAKQAENFELMVTKSENLAKRTMPGKPPPYPSFFKPEEIKKEKKELTAWLLEEDMKVIKAQEEAFFKQIQESIKYDEYMQQQAEKESKRQEDLHRRNLEIIQEERDMKIQAYEATWTKYFEIANQTGGEMGKGLGMMGAGMKGMMDITQGTDPYTAEYNRIAEHYAALIQLKIDKYGAEANIDAEWQSIMVAQEQMSAQQRVATYQNMAGMMAGTMYSMYVAAGSHNKAMFTMYKAFAITEAIISTYAGAARALKDFPFPYSIAVAAIVTAAGLARVAAIAAQKPGGGEATAAAPSGGGGYSYNQPTTPTWEKTEEVKQGKQITIHIHGNVIDHAAFVRELAPYINEAQGDKVLVFE